MCVLTLARGELPVRAAVHFGGFEGSIPAVTAPFSVVVTAAGPQATGPLPGALFGAAFTLLDPPLACDLLHTMPFLSTTAAEKEEMSRV